MATLDDFAGAAIGEALGVSDRAGRKIKAGERGTTIPGLVRLCDMLNIDLGETARLMKRKIDAWNDAHPDVPDAQIPLPLAAE